MGFLRILNRELNPQQREAVLETDYPVLVLSGAGTGKTRTITYKIAYLHLELGIPLSRILALTFTNKAAREMRERALTLIQTHTMSSRQLYIGTFHAICAKILRWHGQSLGYPSDFTIFDEDDQRSLIKRLIKEQVLDPTKKDVFRPKGVLDQISAWKNDFILPDDVLDIKEEGELDQEEREYFLDTVRTIYKQYQSILLESRSMDFDDIQINVIRLFQKEPEIHEFWQKQFQYILVDEFQDTNKVQYILLRMIIPETGEHTTFVGDDDQSIYSFRGANIGNILNLSQDYPNLKILRLEENYRSTPPILQVANIVIGENKNRLGKTLFPHIQKEAPIPILFYSSDGEQEVQFCLDTLQEKDSSESVAIIYRTNRQSILFEKELINRGIPYTLLGGRRFYEKKEIRDIVAYLRLILNPFDQMALFRILNIPPRGIGDISREKLLDMMRKSGLSSLDILAHPPTSLRLSQKTREYLQDLYKIFLDLQETVANNPEQLINILMGALDYPAYLKEYDKGDSEKTEVRFFNIQSLKRSYQIFLSSGGSPQEFIENLALADSSDTQKTPEKETEYPNIVLTSVHGCKGLEFDWVFVVGLVEGIFPHSLSIETEEQLEEERRLFYVALTRARHRLFLVSPGFLFMPGRERYIFEPSRFLKELTEELVGIQRGTDTSTQRSWYEDLLD